MPRSLSHLDSKGHARMVDVGAKKVTQRRAVARGEVRLGAESWRALTSGNTPKGDVLAVARIAGIQGSKKTSELIPLCHPLPLSGITVDLELDEANRAVVIRSEIRCEAKTGAEMEALTSVAIAALTVYDMLKGVDRAIMIGPIYLDEKSGGKSGAWKRREQKNSR